MKLNRVITVIAMTAVLFVGFQLFSGINAEAATAPTPITSMYATGITTCKAVVHWNKVAGIDGYAVARNGRTIKHVGAGVQKITDTGLAIDTTYYYAVRTYKVVRTKQWYNKSTGKWQTAMPASKDRGAYRFIGVRNYSKILKSMAVKTTNPVYKGHGITIKASQVLKKGSHVFFDSGLKCSVCGAGGVTWTLTFDRAANKFDLKGVGRNYKTAMCHHHDSVPLTGICEKPGNVLYGKIGGVEGQINRSKKELVNDHRPGAHSHNFQDMSLEEISELAIPILAAMEKEVDKGDGETEMVPMYPNVTWHGGKTFKWKKDGSENWQQVPTNVVKTLKYEGKNLYCTETPTYWSVDAIYCYKCKKFMSVPKDWP